MKTLKTTTAQPVDGSAPLPDHPDSRPRESDETSRAVAAAVAAGTAEVMGRTHYEKDCCWWIVKRSDRYYAFVNDIGEWCWEVSGKCAANYVQVVGGKAQTTQRRHRMGRNKTL